MAFWIALGAVAMGSLMVFGVAAYAAHQKKINHGDKDSGDAR